MAPTPPALGKLVYVTAGMYRMDQTPGNFVVEGVWAYNERNLASLARCLAREREIYRQWEASASHATVIPALRDRLRQLLVRGPGETGARGGDAAD